jgi:hypothetical protein
MTKIMELRCDAQICLGLDVNEHSCLLKGEQVVNVLLEDYRDPRDCSTPTPWGGGAHTFADGSLAWWTNTPEGTLVNLVRSYEEFNSICKWFAAMKVTQPQTRALKRRLP